MSSFQIKQIMFEKFPVYDYSYRQNSWLSHDLQIVCVSFSAPANCIKLLRHHYGNISKMTFETQTHFFSTFNSSSLHAGRHFSTVYINLTALGLITDRAASLNGIAVIFFFKISAQVTETTYPFNKIFSLNESILRIQNSIQILHIL